MNQRITLPSGTGQQPWVQENAPLPGTTDDRQARVEGALRNKIMISRQGYGTWTYGQLRTLNNALREEAKQRGIENFKVGSLVYAWNDAYGEIAPWAKTRRSIHALDPGFFAELQSWNLLRSWRKIASRLHDTWGISEGNPGRIYSAQCFWPPMGSLSRTVGLTPLCFGILSGCPCRMTGRDHGEWLRHHRN